MKGMLLVIFFLSVAAAVGAQQRTSITRSAPNHTKIVIHNASPAALELRRQRAMEARERMERRRERRLEREHQEELARIRYGQGRGATSFGRESREYVHPPSNISNRTLRAYDFSDLASIRERQARHDANNRPADFKTGGFGRGVTFGGWVWQGNDCGFNGRSRFNGRIRSNGGRGSRGVVCY